jgi:hypothetical protein
MGDGRHEHHGVAFGPGNENGRRVLAQAAVSLLLILL